MGSQPRTKRRNKVTHGEGRRGHRGVQERTELSQQFVGLVALVGEAQDFSQRVDEKFEVERKGLRERKRLAKIALREVGKLAIDKKIRQRLKLTTTSWAREKRTRSRARVSPWIRGPYK